MLPGFGFARLLWFVLLISTLFAFNVGCAEAEEALASWYGPGFQGKPTASGEPYDPNDYTAAHRTLPLGTELIVSYGGRSVPVTVNDRVPYVGNVELDLSQAAAWELGLTRVGMDYVDWGYANERDPSQGVAQEPSLPQETGFTPAGMERSYADGGSYGVSPPDYARSYPPGQGLANGAAFTVQPGDTLSEIAAQLGTTVDELASYNGIADPNIIYSGQALYFPVLEEAPVGAGGTPMADGTMSQSHPNIGDNVPVGGKVVSGLVSGNGQLQLPDRTAVPDGATVPYGAAIGSEGNPVTIPGG